MFVTDASINNTQGYISKTYTLLSLVAGKYEQCHDVIVPESQSYQAYLVTTGSVGGVSLNDSKRLNLQRDNEKTFIQTDRYLYRPGEKVQFRVLTIHGSKMEVSKDQVRGGTWCVLVFVLSFSGAVIFHSFLPLVFF